jgi:hypothetical protein
MDSNIAFPARDFSTSSINNVGNVQKTPANTIAGLKISDATHKGENVEKKMDSSANVTTHSLAKTPDIAETTPTGVKNDVNKIGIFGKFSIGAGNTSNAVGNKIGSAKLNLDFKGLGERNN